MDDNSLLLRFTGSSTMFILVYVDNIIITWSSNDEITTIVKKSNAEFFLDLGDLNYFLGIEVTKIIDEIHLS